MMLTSSADTGTELELGDDMPFDGALTEFLSQIDDDDNVSNGPGRGRDVVEVRIDTTNVFFYAEQIETEEEDD